MSRADDLLRSHTFRLWYLRVGVVLCSFCIVMAAAAGRWLLLAPLGLMLAEVLWLQRLRRRLPVA